jgi:hypothetical protein
VLDNPCRMTIPPRRVCMTRNNMASIFLRGTILLSLLLNSSLAFFTRKNEKSPVPSPNKSCRLKSLQQSFAVQRNNEDGTLKPGLTSLCGSRISIESYQHKDFKLTYLHKRPAPGRENDKPIILVHPVGVGLASWFWIKLMEAFEDNPPIYAPDLIGCGLDHGADPWDPDKVGISPALFSSHFLFHANVKLLLKPVRRVCSFHLVGLKESKH